MKLLPDVVGDRIKTFAVEVPTDAWITKPRSGARGGAVVASAACRPYPTSVVVIMNRYQEA